MCCHHQKCCKTRSVSGKVAGRECIELIIFDEEGINLNAAGGENEVCTHVAPVSSIIKSAIVPKDVTNARIHLVCFGY